jgi:cobalamin biosynthesis protein CobC
VSLQHALALHGVWTRLFDTDQPSLRIGLPGAQGEWARFERALADACA